MPSYNISFNAPSGKEGDLCFYSRFGIDTYRSGCKHDCLYCYARSQNLYQYRRWHPENPTTLDTEWLRGQFFSAFETDKSATRVTSILRQKIPIRIGMNSDPFNPLENERRITHQTLKIFHEYDYPYLIFTKSDLVATDQYLSLYDKNKVYIQMTVTTLNEDYSSKMEPGAALPKDRIKAIKKLNEHGFKTAFRINPLFPIYPDGYYSRGLTTQDGDRLDYFTYELVDELISANPHCIIVGFLRVCNKIMRDEILLKTGIDFNKYFTANKQRYYTTNEIGEYYKKIKEKCDRAGINFSVCFDANRNYETFKHLWANSADCCCAKNMISGFKKTALDVEM